MKLNLSISVESDVETGKILAAYIKVRDGKSAKTREYVPGAVFADFDRKGQLLGIEMLGPVKIAVLQRIAQKESEPTQRFVRSVVPHELVAAS
ncbi:MAG TPA: DUF2283 domain-containing protein [Pirellulales bacterium]|nr:DUF2283 domain-containing protein [Pirellulales bacterium]